MSAVHIIFYQKELNVHSQFTINIKCEQKWIKQHIRFKNIRENSDCLLKSDWFPKEKKISKLN